MTEGILIAVLSLLGTLGGSYFANKKSSALIAYRLEELEKKVDKHNSVIERTYSLEETQAVLEEKNQSRESPDRRPGEESMSGGRRAKKREFSKIIISTVGAVTIFVTAFTLVMVWRTGDTSSLAYLIPAVFTETAAATGFYYSKAKAENRIKLRKKYGPEIYNDTKEL